MPAVNKRAKLSGGRLYTLYGEAGAGKTTFVATMPRHYIIPTEDRHSHIQCRLEDPRPQDSGAVVRHLNWAATDADTSTVILDTVDSLDRMIDIEIRNHYGANEYEASRELGGGFGTASNIKQNHWVSIMAAVTKCRTAGKNVILIGHSTRRTGVTDAGEEYERVEPSLHEATFKMISGVSDAVFFMGIGAGGARFVQTSATPHCFAKQSWNMPQRIQVTKETTWGSAIGIPMRRFFAAPNEAVFDALCAARIYTDSDIKAAIGITFDEIASLDQAAAAKALEVIKK